METTPSKERLIQDLQSFAEEVEGVPTVRGMRKRGPRSPHSYKREFGSWHDALRAAGIQPTHGVTPDVSRDQLLEELKKVDDVTDCPPRRKEVDEHGEYPYTLYDEEFESFIRALEEAGIDPDEKQYRFSSVETPPEKQGSANIEKLRNNGPTPSSELPQGLSTKDRQRGVWKFDMNSGSTRPADAIYYLNGEHMPELILRRFFEQNPHVIEYREPHGIKIDIKKHQPSWQDIGREIVDELVEEGSFPAATFENLAVVRVYQKDVLDYCFENSISTAVDTDKLPISAENTGSRPVWGFSIENKDIWETLSERDGLLFSTRPGQFTHYVPIAETLENADIMTELWVEYEDGIRSGGIENPWPYVVLGEEVREFTLQEQEFAAETDFELREDSIQLIGEGAMESFLNSYAGFESYLRENSRSTESQSAFEFDEDPSAQDLLAVLMQVPEDQIPNYQQKSNLERIEREVRDAAFREGIYEIYRNCAVCGERFESPSGEHNLEAARILPRSHNGPDVLQNGLGLCSRHHWAFDSGWFEITEEYEIRVREYPKLSGYEALEQYDGDYLQVPNEERLRPQSSYIQQRNRLLSPDTE